MWEQETVIHPSAFVSPKAQLGKNVTVGPFSVIHEHVILHDGVKIESYCEIGINTSLGDGSPLRIGEGSLVRSHSIFYRSSTIGKELQTGHHVIVREMTTIGDGCQLGTFSELQGDCIIGNYTKMQSGVFIGKITQVGNFVRISPHVIITNDPTPPSDVLLGAKIGDYASLAAGCMILPGINVGVYSLVAANALVTKDVPPHMVVAGVPARIMGEACSVKLRDGSDEPAYPWTRHFKRGYPPEISRNWTSTPPLTND